MALHVVMALMKPLACLIKHQLLAAQVKWHLSTFLLKMDSNLLNRTTNLDNCDIV